MEKFIIDDYEVLFDKDNHQYYVDGHLVASVSQIVREMLKAPYKNVDPEILKKAALKGTELHDMIEQYEVNGIKTYHHEMQSYITLKRQHQFEVKESETIVLIRHHGAIIAAGRFDMVVESPYLSGLGIVDIKRMAHLKEEHLKLQLNLYKLGYEQTYKKRISYLKCAHIRNRYHQYVDVPIDQDYLQSMLDKYVEAHPIDYTKLI